ncbi:MAG: PSD1 and planctomycete cytochrome C domain-containing protein [Bacteroidales bacterium]|nr:PSD1 and planctomycete cytochrome C domain-containing protein [Bacteroidales bacterium]
MPRLPSLRTAGMAALVCGGTVALLAAEPAQQPTPASTFTPAQVAFFEKEVRPILTQHCLKCHGQEPEKLRGGLDMTRRSGLLAGGDTGPAVDLKKPDASLLLSAIHYRDGLEMPPSGKLPAATIATLTKWVRDGLPWTPGADTGKRVERPPVGPDKNYWAYQPVQRPALPAVRDVAWVKTPVDAFLRAKQEAAGIRPVAPATKAVLCRRAYYDLTGLPPTPEQIDAFVADPAPDAYARLIDTLLASPQYGEKWGRHWLDLVHYAETNGFERDGPKPHAWRYRDYVIRSFNDDKPYDRFIREQLAGDELNRDDPDCVTATGYYRLGLWDDEPADPKLALFDGYDDYVTVTGQAMLGMTLNCCRCHDHKGDFFPHADYYRFVAFFRDIRPYSETRSVISKYSQRDITSQENRKLYEKELAERHKKIESLEAQMIPLEDYAIQKMVPEDQLAVQDGKREAIVRKVPAFRDPLLKPRYLELRRQRDDLKRRPNPYQEFTLAVNHCDPRPPATHLLIRGNPHAPAQEVQPGFPGVLGFPDPQIPESGPDAVTSGRRTALANWIASPKNPLTARVLVNRLWHYHFGVGLVPSPNDFGKLGLKPTHPELLDWLASEFVQPTWQADGAKPWSIKRMHRLLMLSNAYQLSSAADARNLGADPANALRWRFDLRRLTAEEVRDSILAIAGNLNLRQFGPSVYPKLPLEVLAGQSRPGEGWPTSPPQEANRRSIYVHIKRSLQVPILATHDQADSESSCPIRYTTTVPTQALGMLNGEFLTTQAAAFAERLLREAPHDLAAQVARAIRLTTGRKPTDAELAQDLGFIQQMMTQHKLDARTALTRYALLILNTNEFVYLD